MENDFTFKDSGSYLEFPGFKDVYSFSDNDEKEKLLEIYKPVDCIFLEHANEKRTGRNEKFRNVIDLCVKHKDNNYDHVLITRFDLLFKKRFQELKSIMKNINILHEVLKGKGIL